MQATRSDDEQLLDRSKTTIADFLRDPDMSWLQHHIRQAQGVLIAPSVVRAGFIFGGAGGRAVLYTRDPNSGRWVGPAFYNVVLGSFGFQAGVDVSENVVLVTTRKGVDSLLSPSFKLGVQASVAAGPIGAGAATNIMTDFVSFSRAKGVYAGVSLGGGVVSIADDLNDAYYGRAVTPSDILIARNVHGPRNDQLAAELDRAITGRMYGYNTPPAPPSQPAANASPPNATTETASMANTSGTEAGNTMDMNSDQQTIRSAQQALNEKGFDAGAVDGIAGRHTQAAVRKFQKSKGLDQNGRLDQATLEALGVSTSTAQAENAGESNDAGASGNSHRRSNSRTIKSAQVALNDQGFDAGAVDGVWGPHTQGAVRKFQKAKDLQQTGRLDQTTLQALGVPSSVAQAGNSDESNNDQYNKQASNQGNHKSSNNQGAAMNGKAMSSTSGTSSNKMTTAQSSNKTANDSAH
jgi:lipid-binding SYLF domain-containing protein